MGVLGSLAYRPTEILFSLLSRKGLASLAAFFFYITLREVKSNKRSKAERSYNILMLPRLVFIEDVLASLGASGEFKIFRPLSMSIKGIAHGILPPYLDDNFYATETPEAQKCKRAYREFLKKTWFKLGRYIKFDAIVTANFGYYAERELATILEEMGVPFVAMHKENLKSPGRLDFAGMIYRDRRGPFTGRRILVYNETERQLQVEAGVAAPDKITVCGMPRLDRVHRWRQAGAERKSGRGRPRVLFFSFTPKTILPRISRRVGAGMKGNVEDLDGPLEALNWDRLARLTHQVISRLAAEAPTLEVVIKSKGRERDRTELYKMLGGSHDLPPNLKIVVGGDPLELIIDSDVICGFNSTALIEAIAAGKPVVVPNFAEALDDRMRPYIVDLEDAVEYAKSPEELTALLRDKAFAQNPSSIELDAASVRVLDRWVGNSDGGSGQRVRTAILAEIARTLGEEASEIHE